MGFGAHGMNSYHSTILHPFSKFDNQPTIWFVFSMKVIGIFEAKTHFTTLCDDVMRTGTPTLVSKRGKPWVMVTPVPTELSQQRQGILTSWMDWQKNHPTVDDEPDFPDVRQMRSAAKPNPFADE